MACCVQHHKKIDMLKVPDSLRAVGIIFTIWVLKKIKSVLLDWSGYDEIMV